MVPVGRHGQLPGRGDAYTRISEYKHLTGQTHAKTTITYEYPQAEGDPYYRCRAPRTRPCSNATKPWLWTRPT
ncbi:MAG: UDP-galactopyranose mutase [Caulobacteraceae bacterium]